MERKWVHHNKDMVRSTQICWAGEGKETTEGEAPATVLWLSDSIESLAWAGKN